MFLGRKTRGQKDINVYLRLEISFARPFLGEDKWSEYDVQNLNHSTAKT